MKHWAMLVAALYVMALAALTVPFICLALVPTESPAHAIGIITNGAYWLWLGVMFVCQLVMLAVPVRLADRRPVTRRSLWPAILVGGFMMGALVTGAALSVYEFVFTFIKPHSEPVWLSDMPIVLGLLSWIIWAVVFRLSSSGGRISQSVPAQSRWLFRGSILELLIAVPTHIYVRHRNECCAGILTFIGLTMGVSVMLFSFGPAVFILFARRWRQLHPLPRGKAPLAADGQ